MKTVACIIARTNSTRLSNKVLQVIEGKKMIEHIIERVKTVRGIDEIYIATSINPNDQILGEIAKNNNIKVYFGDENSVIDRMLDIAKIEEASNLIRITGDNIFTDPELLEKTLEHHTQFKMEYSRAEFLSLGVTAEVIDVQALKRCYNSIDPNESEYLFYYIFNPELYKTLALIPEVDYYKAEYSSLTVDTPEDLERAKYIFMNTDKKLITYKDIIDLHNKISIPGFLIDRTVEIKLPGDRVINYKDFRDIINKRVQKSQKIYFNL